MQSPWLLPAAAALSAARGRPLLPATTALLCDAPCHAAARPAAAALLHGALRAAGFCSPPPRRCSAQRSAAPCHRSFAQHRVRIPAAWHGRRGREGRCSVRQRHRRRGGPVEEQGRGGEGREEGEREMDEGDTGRRREKQNGRGRGRGLDKEKLAITVGLSYNPVVLCRHHRRLVLRPGGDT